MRNGLITGISLLICVAIVFSNISVAAETQQDGDINITFNKNSQVEGVNVDCNNGTDEYLYLDAYNPVTVKIQVYVEEMGAYSFSTDVEFTDFDDNQPYWVKNFSVEYSGGTKKVYISQNAADEEKLLGKYETDEPGVRYQKKISDIILKKGVNTISLMFASSGAANDIKLYSATAQKYPARCFSGDESGTIRFDTIPQNTVPFETKTDKYGTISDGLNLRGTGSAPNYATFMINSNYDTYEMELTVNPYCYEGDSKFGFMIYIDDMSSPAVKCLDSYKPSDYPAKKDGVLLIKKFIKIDNSVSGEHQIRIAFVKNTGSIMRIKNVKMSRITSVIPKTDKRYDYVENMLDEYDKLFLNTVAIDENSPIIKVHGALRYIDYNNLEKRPLNVNGALYLPLKTISDAFGFYFEYDYDARYFYLRTNTNEFAYKNGTFYSNPYRRGFCAAESDWIIADNECYVPFEKYACDGEITTFSVGGMIFADTAQNIEKIRSDSLALSKISAEFGAFSQRHIGTVYYVSKHENSSDGNDGSKDNPFNTLTKAASVAKSGDTVIIGDGIYRETLAPLNDGEAGAPVLYIADDGAKPIISALEHIGNPTVVNGLWCFDLDFNLGTGRNELFVNGSALAEGRYPNSPNIDIRYVDFGLNLCNLWPVAGDIKISDDNNKLAVSDSVLNQDEDFWKGATLVSLHGLGYNLGTAKIISSANGSLSLGDTTLNKWFDYGGSDADFAFITNSLNTVDLPGEWYMGDENRLYFYPIEGVAANDIELKKRHLVINLTDRQHIIISGISTIGGGVLMKNSNMCALRNCDFKYISHYVYADDQRYGYFDTNDYDGHWDVNLSDKNGAPQRGESGIYISGNNNAVMGCNISYSASAGIYLTGLNTYIADNSISQCGYAGGCPGGIFIMPSPIEQRITTPRGSYAIYRNSISEIGRAGIGISAVEAMWFYAYGISPFLPSDIAYNDIRNTSILSRDTGAIYIHGVNLGYGEYKTKIHHNTISNSLCYSAQNHGIYFDNFIVNVECCSNVLFKSSDWGSIENSSKIYMQPKYMFPDAYAEIDEWDNSSVWYKCVADKSELNEADYPCAMPFSTGNDEDKIKNIDNVSAGSAHNSALPLTLNAGDTVVFDNLRFDGANAVSVIFSGDESNTGDCLRFDVYDGDDLLFSTAQNFYAKTPSDNYCQSMFVPLDKLCGTYNFKVTAEKSESIKLWTVKPVKISDDVYNDIPMSKTFFGNYSQLTYSSPHYNPEKNGTPGRIVYGPGSHDKTQMMADRANFSPIYRFDNVYIAENVKKFKLCYPGYLPHAGGAVMEVYADSLNSESVAVVKLDKTSQYDYSILSVALTKELSEGLHDIYIKINADRTDRSYTLWWFGFDKGTYGINSVSESAGSLTVDFDVPNGDFGVCIIELTDQNNNLIDVKTLGDDNKTVFNKPADGIYKFKMFLWDSVKNMIPLQKFISYRYVVK